MFLVTFFSKMPLDFPWPFEDQSTKVLGQLRWKLSSRFVLTGVGLFSKVLGGYLNKASVYNKERIVDLVERRPQGQSLITVSNHYSCIDDPLVWGAVFSGRTLLLKNHLIRWIPSAHDICFTRKIYTWFFIRGRSIPIVRGDGVYQKGMDMCVEKLNEGEWVHIFAEGGINMTKEFKRFKWGVGRLINDAKHLPIVLPFFHVGCDDILANHPPYIPKIGKRTTILVGEPIDFTEHLQSLRSQGKTDIEIRKSLTDRIQEEIGKLKQSAEQLHYGRSSISDNISGNKKDKS